MKKDDSNSMIGNIVKSAVKNAGKKMVKKYVLKHLLVIILPLILVISIFSYLTLDVGYSGDVVISDKLSSKENTEVFDDLQEYLSKEINVPMDDYYGIAERFALTTGNVLGYLKYIETREGKDADNLFGTGAYKNIVDNNAQKSIVKNLKPYVVTNGKYEITSPFGLRIHPIDKTPKNHTGIDIGVPNKTPIYALLDGKVTTSGNVSGYGNTIIINHDDITSLYGHNSSLVVSVGQKVKQGQLIAYSGSSGNSTGPHLHFEIRDSSDKPIDPEGYYTGNGPGTKDVDSISSNDMVDNFKEATHKYADKLKPEFTMEEMTLKDVWSHTKTTTVIGGVQIKTPVVDTDNKKIKVLKKVKCIYGNININYTSETTTSVSSDGTHTITKPDYAGYSLDGEMFAPLKSIIKQDYPDETDIMMAISFVVNSSQNFDKKEKNGDWINKKPEDISIDDLIGDAVGSAVDTSFSGDIPLFLQWDSKWASHPYSSSTLRHTGCGPTALAMVVTGLEGNLKGADSNKDGIFTPDEAADFSTSHGAVVPGSGTVPDVLFAAAKSAFGLNYTHYSKSQGAQVIEELRKGNPVIANVHGSESIPYGSPGSTFTQHGHFIVLVSIDAKNQVKVNDPAGNAGQNKKLWDFSSIINAESSDFWAFYNPNLKFDSYYLTYYTNGGGINGGGITADGTSLVGKDVSIRSIAVDPSKIPLGSLVYIKFPSNNRYITLANGTKFDKNGVYVARDTGGAIKGKRIDMFIGSDSFWRSIQSSCANTNVGVRIKKR